MSAKIKLEDLSKEELIEKYLELDKKFDKAVEQIERLQKELRKYKNAHTPSSQKRFEKIKVQGLKVGRKKGKKSNHKGRTRAKEKIDRSVNVTSEINPSTGNKNIKPTGYIDEVTIIDFEIVKVVTKYNCYEYQDLDTGELFIARHPDMPNRGIFGKNVLAFANFLRWKCRVPFDKISSVFTSPFKISMTAPTAMDICTRVANKTIPYYNKLRKNIKSEIAVNVDETGAKRNGLPGWLWGFFSIRIALFVFNIQRGGDIINKVLDKKFSGVLGCDGWSSYSRYSQDNGILLQRCWAHVIRELKEIRYKKKKPEKSVVMAYDWLCAIFEKIKEARKYRSQEIREQLYIELVDDLNLWIQIYKPYRTIKHFVDKMENAENFWFTCVLHLEIEPTNNRAERGLRQWRVLEKIIGCLRSEQGFRTTEIMMSLFETWELRKINQYEKLRALL